MVVNLSDMDYATCTVTPPGSVPFRVGFVLLDGFALMSYASAMEPLRACNLLAGQCLYDIRHLPVKGEHAVSSSGAMIRASARLGHSMDFDLVLVVAGGELSMCEEPELYSWLQRLAAAKVLIGGVSGGPLLLARAGIMEGRRMTVHWDHVQVLTAVSPGLRIERSLYVRDRDRLTCAGGTAALDMMHALISERHGAALAQKISDWFMHTDIRPGENAQRSGIAERYAVTERAIIASIEAMENHLADPLELSQLASLAGLGVRQMNRLFHDRLGTSTIRFYRQMRLRKAHALLRSTTWSLDDVASATGFANGAHLSRVFSEGYGVSPRHFRQESVGRQTG